MASEGGQQGTGSELVKKQEMGLMLPPAPRPAKRRRVQTVLEEDEWTEKLEAIIQRDYFPDIPKLESELEWLEAIKTKDPSIIRQAQHNIASRRAGLKTPMGQTPAHFATPATGLRGDISTPGFNTSLPARPVEQQEEGGVSAAPDMSLDQFMARHTSEDNASFSEILEAINKRKRERYHWLYDQIEAKKAKLLENGRPLDGFGTSGQPNGALLTWNYEPKNQLYYGREAVPLTEKELSLMVQGPEKQILASATRLPGSAIDDTLLEAARKPVRGDEYSEIATPSFDESASLMHLSNLVAAEEEGQNPTAAENTGPHFKIHERKPRDRAGLRLAEGARVSIQKRAQLLSPSLILRKTPGLRGKASLGTPLRHKTPGIGISPAAHRLATNLKGNKSKSSADSQLRAAYSRTGQRTPWEITPARLSTATPAILPDADDVEFNPKFRNLPQGAIREEAIKSFEPTAHRREALKAFEPITHRQEALKAFKITDDLLKL